MYILANDPSAYKGSNFETTINLQWRIFPGTTYDCLNTSISTNRVNKNVSSQFQGIVWNIIISTDLMRCADFGPVSISPKKKPKAQLYFH